MLTYKMWLKMARWYLRKTISIFEGFLPYIGYVDQDATKQCLLPLPKKGRYFILRVRKIVQGICLYKLTEKQCISE